MFTGTVKLIVSHCQSEEYAYITKSCVGRSAKARMTVSTLDAGSVSCREERRGTVIYGS